MCKSCDDARKPIEYKPRFIYHVDPIKTSLGRDIPNHFQVHKQVEGSPVWNFVACFRMEREHCDEMYQVCCIQGTLKPEEIVLVEDRLVKMHRKAK